MTLVGDHRRPRGGPRTLTAASAQATVQRGQVAVPKQMRADDADLWRYYREVGVVHYGIGFKRANATRARFLPARVGEPGNDPEPIDPGDPTDREVARIFEELDGGRGRIAEAVGEAMVHLDVTGVAWPVYQVRAGEDRLTVYGTEEVTRQSSRVRLTAETVTGGAWPISTEGDDGDLLAVVWRPSPQDHSAPDSPLRSVVSECEMLVAVRLAMRAGYLSRVPAGIITVPDELNPFPPSTDGSNPLLEDMMTALTAAIKDPGSAAAVAPYLLSGPGDVADKVRHVDLGRRVYPEDIDLAQSLTRQIATGLDIPAELFDLGGMNHWSAWLVDASAYRAHIDPTLRLALDGLTRRIFRPLLQRRLGWSEEEAEQFTLWRDISDLVASPNRVADAVSLFDRGIIAAAPVRRVAGYDETDAPGGDVAPGPTPSEAPAEAPRQVEPGPPETEQPGAATLVAAATPTLSGAGLASIDRTLLVRLHEASRQAIRRALDRAGARARNRLRGAADLHLVVEGWPNRDVCARLGRQTVLERLALAEADLVTEEDFRDFEADAQRMLDRAVGASAEEAARLGGAVSRDGGEEAESVDRAVAALVAAALAATVSRLFTPDADQDPAESGEVAEPGGLDPATIMDAVTVAGGGAGAAVALGALLELGVGNGARVTGWLRDGGVVTVGNRWVYGDRSLRATNFEPHLALDGIEFASWEDPRLSVTGPWPRVSHYRPQDHRGCLCGFERVLTRVDVGR